MNQQLRTLQIALRQCLVNGDITAQEITEVVRETVKQKMDEATMTVAKSRTVLDKLSIPHHYTTCPDYLNAEEESVTINFDDIPDSINLIDTIGDNTIPPFV